jgi:predicted DNA-binding transcriptional regulator AlpA
MKFKRPWFFSLIHLLLTVLEGISMSEATLRRLVLKKQFPAFLNIGGRRF